MRAFLAGAAGALRDNAAKAAGAAAFAAVSGFSALTAANFWYLFGADPLATAALCGSFAALGFAAGFALCWLAQRYGRVGRMRRLLLRLPANQRAACWDAYRREGAFPDREHAADLEVLSRLGAVEKVEGQPGTMWSLSQAAREAISGSRQLSGKLEASLAERDRLRDERARERAVERAAGYIGELGFAERRELAVLIDRGQIVCDGDVRDALIDRFGHALVEVDEVSPSEIEVRPTDAAVEADRREPSLLARAREYGALRDGGSDE